MKLILSALFFSTAFSASASDYSWLKIFDKAPEQWAFEETREIHSLHNEASAEADLTSFYDHFEKDKKVTIGIAWGQDADESWRPSGLEQALQTLLTQQGIETSEWTHDAAKKQISFRKTEGAVLYVISYSMERNDYIRYYKKNEIVMYHGHSRYGRGPAFGSYTNYFRLGLRWETIEVETNNPYFLNEPIMLQDQYPVSEITIDTKVYPFQYQGGKTEGSYLYSDYVKNVEGNGIDFMNADFKAGKQIFWYYSCKNKGYWKKAIRTKFPNTNEKFVFGTLVDGYWSNAPAATFIANVVGRKTSSSEVVQTLNSVNDCGGIQNCWAAY